jgi:hypothetical protein
MEKKKQIVNLKIISPATKLAEIYSECFRDEDFGHLFFLGVLAYPQFKERNRVINFVLSVFALKSKALSKHFHTRRFLDEKLKGFEARKAERNIKHAFDIRIPRRIQAVVIAMNFVNRWESSLNKAVSHLIEGMTHDNDGKGAWRGADSGNVYNNIWTESKTVLHMACAMYSLIDKVFSDDEKPDFLSFTILDDLKQRGTNNIKQELNIDIFELPLKDLFLLSHSVRIKHKIETPLDLLISSEWLPDILKVANAWGVLLPKLIHAKQRTIKQESLIKI